MSTRSRRLDRAARRVCGGAVVPDRTGAAAGKCHGAQLVCLATGHDRRTALRHTLQDCRRQGHADTHVRRTGREGGDRPLPAVLHRVRRHCRRFNRDQQRQGDVAVSSLVVGYERCRGGRRRTAHGNGVCRWSGLAGGVESLCQEQGRIPDRSGRPYVKELCRGLGYVHALPDLQLVHRDVSPPNVLLSYRGEIKLADSCSHRRHR